jgi:hypothetical protein
MMMKREDGGVSHHPRMIKEDFVMVMTALTEVR